MNKDMRWFGTAVFAALATLMILVVGAYPALAVEDTSGDGRVAGDGWIYAEGRGRALLEGTGTVALNGIGQLIVVGKDVDTHTDGRGKVIRLGPFVTVYRGRGVAIVKGEDMTVFAKGTGRLAARGEGMAIIRGSGDWEIGKWRTWENTEVEPYDEPYEVHPMGPPGMMHERKNRAWGLFHE
ncbi:MAG: hypothetical protein CW694_00335 [Candidatus Syntrophoarchaeum sp. WYZ-LMO15]|nr:MAG: hypothetical protein CW694_00335 [Candidatus Syntrophoarchaeum sp. WYZ-LMO15]